VTTDDDDHELQALELAQLDYQLDAEQRRLNDLFDTDPLKALWFE
jgi:hypothetical protein